MRTGTAAGRTEGETVATTIADPLRQAVRGVWVMILRNRRAVRDALVILGLLRAFVYYVVQGIDPVHVIGLDTRAYWRVDLAHPYAASGVGDISTYLYPPIFAQVLAPFSLLPFPLFYGLWTAMAIGLLVWLVRPWPWALAILALPISYELLVGQVHLVIAAVVVLGFARPALWAIPILTKVTPGVGVLWFGFRREWRKLAIALGVTGAVVAISFVAYPTAWFEWVAFVLGSTQRGEALPLRLAIAVGIMAVAGLTNRKWMVPIAVTLAFPVVWVETYVVLLAMVRIVDDAGGLEKAEPLTAIGSRPAETP